MEFLQVRVPSVRPLTQRLAKVVGFATRQFERTYWAQPVVRAIAAVVGNRAFDVIIANDLITLPVGSRISRGHSRLIFDAHEYYAREFENSLAWRLLQQRYVHTLCERYLRRTDAVMTVCQGIADEYARVYSVTPVVVTNAPHYQDLHPRPTEGGVVRMLHHGSATQERCLEDMIEMMSYLDDRFRLDFMLVSSASQREYSAHLADLARGDPRIRFVPPVPMPVIPSVCNSYDVGVYLLRPTSFNARHALPNKMFEFVQGRMALAVGPSPEMSQLVREHDCGVVADDFTPRALANALNTLTRERIDYYKRRSHAAARQLSAERNAQIIIDLVEGNQPCAGSPG